MGRGRWSFACLPATHLLLCSPVPKGHGLVPGVGPPVLKGMAGRRISESSEFELYLRTVPPEFFPHWKQTHLLFWVVTEMTFMTYSNVGIIFRSRKTKTYCGSDKIKAVADKNIYKGRWCLSAKQQQGISASKHKEIKRSQARFSDGLYTSLHLFLQEDSAKGKKMDSDVGCWV